MPEVADPGPAEPGGPPLSLLGAVAVVGLQVAALAVLGVIVLVKVITGSPHSIVAGLLGAVWAFVGALILGLCGRAILRLRPAARTPIVVIELLALPVSYSLAFPSDRPEYGAPILVSALTVLYLLFTPAARTVLDRRR